MNKSLKIVNENLNYSYYMKECHNKKTNIILTPKQVEQIKQDLEVLEIIKNKKVDVYYLHTLLKNGEVDVVLNRYNIYAREGALTMEELLKLKQWLEVN